MLSADAAFANAANAAAAAFASEPPYVAYRLALQTNDGTTEHATSVRIVVRNSDDAATIDDGTGHSERTSTLALPPAIDALANWAFALEKADGLPVMHVTYQEPRRYAFATPGPDADVVVPGINGFTVRYADGDATHLELFPATAFTRALATEVDRFLYRDVWFDPSTWLPSRVVVAAVNAKLTLDYTAQSGHWLLSHVRYDGTEGSRPTSPRITIDATYSGYTFPVVAPGFR
jgi:hypothetical protein